jgi:hypothetical protein
MRDPTKPASKAKFLAAGIVLLGFAAWEMHDGLYSLTTGRPVMVQMHPMTALESFGISAATVVIAIVVSQLQRDGSSLGPKDLGKSQRYAGAERISSIEE